MILRYFQCGWLIKYNFRNNNCINITWYKRMHLKSQRPNLQAVRKKSIRIATSVLPVNLLSNSSVHTIVFQPGGEIAGEMTSTD